MSKGNEIRVSGGIGFAGALTIAFVVLKLTNVIGWSWGWVLAPVWIKAILIVVIIIASVCVDCWENRK